MSNRLFYPYFLNSFLIVFSCSLFPLFLVLVLVTVLVLVKVIFGFVLRLLNNHFTFYISYLGMNYSNVIGFLLFLVFILQFISGLLLSCYYSPFSIMAFDSVSGSRSAGITLIKSFIPISLLKAGSGPLSLIPFSL